MGYTERLTLGEAYMICDNCGARLYSFCGSEDRSRKCPCPKKCEEEQNSLKEMNPYYKRRLLDL